jgi:uncharacterized membrane protein SirB2
MYAALKQVHTWTAILTISGFMLRGLWMLRQSPLLQHRLTRILPHVIDTVFLLSGIGLVAVLQIPVSDAPWLIAKIVALVVYILLGTVALKRGRTPAIRQVSFVLALAAFAYIVGVAIYKTPWSWFAAT